MWLGLSIPIQTNTVRHPHISGWAPLKTTLHSKQHLQCRNRNRTLRTRLWLHTRRIFLARGSLMYTTTSGAAWAPLWTIRHRGILCKHNHELPTHNPIRASYQDHSLPSSPVPVLALPHHFFDWRNLLNSCYWFPIESEACNTAVDSFSSPGFEPALKRVWI